MKRQPIFGLDAIRFFAAMAVVVNHVAYKPFAAANSDLHFRFGHPLYTPAWSGFSWWGWIGVQIFFVISGLVIAYSASGASPYSFVRSRVARLLPAMLICATFIALVVATWGGKPALPTLILWFKSVTFFPLGSLLTAQFWTLGVEIFFYGAVWLMIVFRKVHRLEVLAWGLAIISAIYWACVFSGAVSDEFLRLTQLLLFQHGCYFALGILLSVADGDRMTPRRWLLAAICVVTAWFQIATTTASEVPAYAGSLMACVPYAIWLITSVTIGACLYWKKHIADFVGSTAKYWRATGLATYPLYLIHTHTGGPVVVELVRAGFPDALAVVASIVVSVAAAFVVALFLEPPVHRLVLAVFGRLSEGFEDRRRKAAKA